MNQCNKCFETITDLDAGFSPGLHEMAHGCGGTWHIVTSANLGLPAEDENSVAPFTLDKIERSAMGVPLRCRILGCLGCELCGGAS